MKQLLFSFILIGLLSCGSDGGGTTTTSSTSSLTGSVASSSSVSLGEKAVACVVDKVIATNTSAVATSSDVQTDCSFSLSLTPNASYVISFTKNNVFVATLTFSTGQNALTTTGVPLPATAKTFGLGLISISGTVASPQNNPLTLIDHDGDGLSDYDDSDDDGDGVDDDSEEDCDLDGIKDDYDDSKDCSSSSSSSSTTAKVVEVEPSNGETGVGKSKKPKARINCSVNQSDVTASTFQVKDSSQNAVSCTFSFSGGRKDSTSIECEPSTNLTSSTTYTVTLSGISCGNGSTISNTSWSFTVED